MDAAVSALLGAAIGSIPSFLAMVIQSRMKDKRDRSKQVTDMSLAQYKAHLEGVVAGKGRSILPLSMYIRHNDLILRALETDTFTPERLREIDASMDAMEAVVQSNKPTASSKARE